MTYLLPLISILASNAIAIPVIAQSNNKASTNSKISNQVTNNPESASPVILYVNPLTGSDRPENGSNASPFKSISYAVSRIQDGNSRIIQLANGTYSTATGERFPIRLQANVTLRGNEANKGKGIAILGGGSFLPASKFPQNVAIALADRAELRGVTVTNPNPRGYGLWIENVSPAIANNTFLDNQHDGILITGKSTAIISANQFFRNGTSGLAIEGEASPDIRGNLFQQTTFGMSIRQDAAPQITENTFTQNQNGILIQANAKPVLRGNVIVNNRSYGLTISDLATPDLGKPNEDGGNVFQGNGIFDLQNVSRNAVAVIGNQLDSKRVKGNLQLSNVRPPSNLFAAANSNSIRNNPSFSNSAPSSPLTTPLTTPIKGDRFANINQQLEQRIATSQTMNFAPNLDTPPALVRNALSPNASNQANNPFWYEPVTPLIIRITPKRIDSPVPPNTEINSSLRPVVSRPPSGEPVNQPIQIAPLGNTNFKPQVPPRYRVVVPVGSPNAVAQVRQIVPNSFASRLNGYLVVQIGAYSDRRIAEVQVSRLAQKGLNARIESINP
ncbi:DUF1565 domain-containing protein [Pseudanabaena sp. FACHB-1998]|nr:DUF1565 domain-containing protein [Pseudanabaena sp. FACHB-1998]